ncbi:hypothetical protein DYH09_13310 [bacterium CPR1]|nr:hypothetical protein [bacterium CPR1]
MIDIKRVGSILDRLGPAAEREGLTLELCRVNEESVIELRARRNAPGVPIAFMVRAIEGTFRRYYPEVSGVRLVDYDPGPDEVRAQKTRIEDTVFAPLVRHKAPIVPAPAGIPGLDLRGLDRARAVRALENFVDLWGPREVDRLKIVGRTEDGPGRAIQKWLHLYADRVQSQHPDATDPEALILHLSRACQDPSCSQGEPVELMPGKILLTAEEDFA